MHPVINIICDKGMNMNIGKRIREIRNSKGQSQEQFSNCIGISPRHLKRLENGICENTTIDTIAIIVFNSDTNDFTFTVEKQDEEVCFSVTCKKKNVKAGDLYDQSVESKQKLQQ